MSIPNFQGANADLFNKGSMAVYLNFDSGLDDNSWVYVGKTQNAKTLTPVMEEMEWKDNETGTAQTYVKDISESGMSIAFSFMQFGDINALALALNGELDDTDATYNVLHLLENPDSMIDFGFRGIGQLKDGRAFRITLYRCNGKASGDISFGDIGNYSEVPITVTALKYGEATPEGKLSYGKIEVARVNS